MSDADKTLHLLEQMYKLSLFTRKFMEDWEEALPTSYALTLTHFSVELEKIRRAQA